MTQRRADGVLLCAGSGSRMGGENKLLRPILGKSSIMRCLDSLLASEDLERLVLVLPAEAKLRETILEMLELRTDASRCLAVDGGACRGESVWKGLQALAERPPMLVAIHDAARPLFKPESLKRCLDSAAIHGSGIPGKPVVDTLRRTDKCGGWIGEIDRENVWCVETPQCFRFEEIYAAYENAGNERGNFSDDGAVYLRWGGRPRMVATEEENLKITLPGDFERVEAILRMRGESNRSYRVGLGEDSHRLCPGRPLLLGGVEIPHHMGLEGHSDADALCHALTDALLGALALGDIGRHFPDDDPAFQGADSVALLKRVYEMVGKEGGKLLNADAVITAEKPKLARYIPNIQENLERALNLPTGSISVKAKTAEGLGPEGRGESISVRAIVNLEITTG